MKFRLRDFLASGVLLNVCLSMNETDVEICLGSPNVYGPLDFGHILWQYGPIEITFYKDNVSAIGLYTGRRSDFPDSIDIDGYIPNEHTNIDEFIEFAKSESLSFGEDISLTRIISPGRAIAFSSGVYALHYGDNHILDHFYLSGPLGENKVIVPI